MPPGQHPEGSLVDGLVDISISGRMAFSLVCIERAVELLRTGSPEMDQLLGLL